MSDVRIDLLPPEIATWLVALLTLAAFGFWVAVRVFTHRVGARLPRLAIVLPRAFAASAASWFLLQLIARVATYACPWPLWLAALMLGLGVEIVAACLSRERRVLSPRQGAMILLLRALAVALTVLILMQPVLVRLRDKHITRRVAVLVDDSDSMRFADRQWQPFQRLQWAAFAGLFDAARHQAALTNAAAAQTVWDALPEATRSAVNVFCETSRLALARSVLMRPVAGATPLFEKLGERYDLDLFTFARKLARTTVAEFMSETNIVAETSFTERHLRGATDLAAALEGVLKEIPSEQLAGVLVLSDGLHNSDTSLLPVTRRFGAQGAPISGMMIGGARLACDVSIADAATPESIFLGDRVRIAATVRATGAIGRKVKVELLNETNVVEVQELKIASDEWQREIRMSHEPQTNGVERYEIRAELLEGELFDDNNAWRFDVAVSDDRINVLLVDHSPRWEFRYLRNLFFGRDKSVHLQSWLVNPDKLAGAADSKLPPASAERKFGDAEAGGWPQSREAWRAFDVIILGDLDPLTLTPEIQNEIRASVADRGALLVLVSGSRAMPHAFAPDSPLAELVPFTVQQRESHWQGPEKSFRLALTPTGQQHPVMLQSGSLLENEEIWNALPPFAWRLSVVAKPGAEILAVAQPENGEREQVLTDVRQAAAHLEAIMQHRARHALIAAQQVGRGKVLGMAFDGTWRLRYRTGDTYHHRFWGQVMRWGLGERLRTGEECFRIGTDRLTYAPDEPISVMARLLDDAFAGINDAKLEAVLRNEAGDELTRVTLEPRSDSHGFYETVLPPQPQAGVFTVEVARRDKAASRQLKTSFLVTASRRPIEMGTVRPTSELLSTLAKGTGGRVVTPERLAELSETFGEGRGIVQERREIALWNSPYVLLLLALLLTAEWLLRKRGGLA